MEKQKEEKLTKNFKINLALILIGVILFFLTLIFWTQGVDAHKIIGHHTDGTPIESFEISNLGFFVSFIITASLALISISVGTIRSIK